MTKAQHYDAVIIGAGQAGGPLSTTLARAGWKTALVERQYVGGSCINFGCTPTKTMVASARAAYLARRGTDYGVRTGSISVDMVKVRQRKRDIVERFRSGSQSRIEKTEGVDLLFGEARFTGPRVLEVRPADGGALSLTADKVFINSGTRAERPAIEGLDSVPTLDNASVMELDTLPEHLLVLGGGYIGLEFGQMFRRFGSRVTLLQSDKQLLAREDTDVAEEVTNILRQDGVEVLLESRTQRVRPAGGNIQLQMRTPEGERTVVGSHLLLATGRGPDTERLNPAAAGIETDGKGFIKVNPRLETTAAGVWALGDVKGPPAFTHISYDDFRLIRANLLQGGNRTTEGRLVPYTVFIDPQLGRVGLSERQARQQGRNIRVAKLPMTSVARALEFDETRGFMKAVVDAETNQILGAAILGLEGGEVMAVLQMAMMGKVPYTAIRNGVFAHPTLAESLNNLFMAMDRS
jgi:pyruvate/2-oxoglutarate dehydrogenase complex dihydrolipoamide dehydrogenase (E3) component